MLSNLQGYADDFLAAVDLFDHSDFLYRSVSLLPSPGVNRNQMSPEQIRFMQWMIIAGRDGAITLYNFHEAMQAIRSSFHKVPTLQPITNTNLLKTAYKAFQKQFPDVKNMRDAVAHTSELINTPAKAVSNPIKGVVSLFPIKAPKGSQAIKIHFKEGHF